MNNTLILCTYMYEDSSVGANTRAYVAPSLFEGKQWAQGLLYATVSNGSDEDVKLVNDWMNINIKHGDEPLEFSLFDDPDEQGSIEWSDEGFRLVIGDETHVCRYDPVVEGLVVELS